MMVIFFYFLNSVYVKEHVCVCDLINESVVLFNLLLHPNPKNKKEKATLLLRNNFDCFKIPASVLDNWIFLGGLLLKDGALKVFLYLCLLYSKCF